MRSQEMIGGMRADDGIEPGGMLLHVDNISVVLWRREGDCPTFPSTS